VSVASLSWLRKYELSGLCDLELLVPLTLVRPYNALKIGGELRPRVYAEKLDAGSFRFKLVIIKSGSKGICGRSRFPAPESGIHTSRIFAIKISDRVVYAETSKNEDTWRRVLRYLDTE
jgi:hypothetical protein